MAALIPATQAPNVEAAYEDMFKEITRKLYGEETGNGLHTLGTPVAHVATSGPTAPEGERSFTTLMSDRSLAPTIEYDQNGSTATSTANNFKTEENITTAFGLAALMQNGFPTSGTILNTQNLTKSTVPTASSSNSVNAPNISTVNSSNTNVTEQRWGASNEEVINWPTGGKLTSFNGSQKTIKSTKNREQNEMYHSASTTNNNTTSRKNKTSGNNQNSVVNNNQTQIQKRYSCSHCPYSTDRRDLYTRHENIHKDEKPFQCYACLKQFNRADHVKKHFLRMHRELAYDINKTRRTITAEQKPNVFAQNVTNNQQQQMNNYHNSQRHNTTVQDTSLSIAQTIESVATAQVTQHSTTQQMKQEKSPEEKVTVKVKREKRFSCCYCPWSGADKWGLKRHLNTHTKPFVCMLCDYKAARSERLATHVLKVHNKKACNKCSFLAESQEEYQTHINEIHPHDQRPSRNNNNNTNVLRTIGNTLVTNSQINNFQNPSTSFGGIQTTTTTTSGVAIYTTNDPTINTNNNNNNANGMQEIVVNPSSMVGWRLSASGSLIPPHIHNITGNNEQSGGGGGNSGNSNQKRGAERLFQYLEADGSDPEDYTRQLKMDAISRNTASVAQDFLNAGGVEQNSENFSSKTNQEATFSSIKGKQHTISKHVQSNVLNPMLYQKRAMSISFENQNQHEQQLKKSPPAYHNNDNKTNALKWHRLNLTQQDKENSNSIFSNMEYQNFSEIGVKFHNYIKEIINKYYAEAPLMCSADMLQKREEPKDYIEYLKNKDGISIISTKSLAVEKRNRKQSQPKKITKPDIMSVLRDKYMKSLVDRKKSCLICTKKNKSHMLVFPYHKAGSLALHRFWRHSSTTVTCKICKKSFKKRYSYDIHLKTKHSQ